MAKNFNLTNLKIFLDSKKLVLNPFTGKSLLLKEQRTDKTKGCHVKKNKYKHFKGGQL